MIRAYPKDRSLYVHSDGRVYNTKTGKYLSFSHNQDGYLQCTRKLGGKITSIKHHRIICETFHSNPLKKEQVNHINGIKDDNRLENLEWSTPSENVKHSHDTGLKISHVGEKCGKSILTELEVIDIIHLRKQGKLHREISKIIGCSRHTVTDILNNKTWKHIPR